MRHWKLIVFAGAIFVWLITFTPPCQRMSFRNAVEEARAENSNLMAHFPRTDSDRIRLIRHRRVPGMLQTGPMFFAHFEGEDGHFVEELRKTWRPRNTLKIRDDYSVSERGGNPEKLLSDAEFNQLMGSHWFSSMRWMYGGKSDPYSEGDLMKQMSQYEPILLEEVKSNHGHSAGLFISKQGNDAIFWSEL